MKTNICPLEKGRFYHIFNRGNAGTNLFYNKANYEFFLHRYAQYVSPYVETYALCLLPNHFHLLVRIKEEPDLGTETPPFEKVASLDSPSDAFRKFFTSYSMAINKQQKRHGSLFEKPFRRKEITNTKYLANLVFYIHANPQLHGITNDFRMYPWSSYERILHKTPSKLQKEAVLHWFDSAENYIAYHAQKNDIEKIKELMIE